MIRRRRQPIHHVIEQPQPSRFAVALLGDRLADVAEEVPAIFALDQMVLEGGREAMAGAVDAGVGREAALLANVYPAPLVKDVAIFLDLVGRAQLGEEDVLAAAAAFPDEVDQAEPDQFAVQRNGSDGAVVLDAAGLRLVDLDVRDAVQVPEVIGAKLADLLAAGAGVVEEQRDPIEGVMNDRRARREAGPKSDLAGSPAVPLGAGEDRQGEQLLEVLKARRRALAAVALLLRDADVEVLE